HGGHPRPRASRARWSRWARLLLASGLSLLLAVAIVGVVLHRIAEHYDHTFRHQALLDPLARRAENATLKLSGPLNYLIIGTDRRPAQQHPDERADTVLIAHLPAGLRRAYLVSVPR